MAFFKKVKVLFLFWLCSQEVNALVWMKTNQIKHIVIELKSNIQLFNILIIIHLNYL